MAVEFRETVSSVVSCPSFKMRKEKLYIREGDFIDPGNLLVADPPKYLSTARG
jgi:hypothetical protein